jgi:hypothetical protein
VNDPIMTHPPGAELTAPGMGAHIPFNCTPHAGDACLCNGVPSVVLVIGEICGRDIALVITDPSVLAELEYAARLANARLAMWGQDHKEAAA